MSALWILHFPQVEMFSICLFSQQTDGEHKQIKKHLTCEDVIQWILVWTINFTFMHLIYNVRQKYGIWSLLVHEISILQYFANLNIVYIHVLYPYLDIVIVKMSNSQSIIFHIYMNSKYKRRKMFTSYLN
jgi:hypothetical protein